MIRLVCPVLMALVLVAGSASATHAEDELGLSWDGATWSDRLPGPLFDESVRWVPGDVRTNRFFVRNQAEDGATLSIAVRTRDDDRLLRDDEIVLKAQVGDDSWMPFDRVGEGYQLNQQLLGVDERARVRVRAAFDPGANNQSRHDELALRFRVTLADARAGGVPGPDAVTGGSSGQEQDAVPGSGVLPSTGAPQFGWLILLAATLIGSGLALVRRRRREVASDDG